MNTTEIISLIGLIGFGGLLNSILNMFIDGKKRKTESKHDFKQTRYKAIILQCFTLIYWERENPKLLIHRPDLKTKNILYDEIYTEWINMTLYASDKVINSMKTFLEDSNQKNFNNMILCMRKDLYGIRTKLNNEDLTIIK